MDLTATPLNDAIADLAPDDSGRIPGGHGAGATRRQVDHLLDAALELLEEHRDGRGGMEPIARAAEHVQAAIDALTHYHERLARLGA